MYQHILIPIDGSPLSVETVSRGVRFAKKLDAKVTFFHFVENSAASFLGESALFYSMAPSVYAEKYEWRQNAILWKAEAEALNKGVCFESVISRSGTVDEAIIGAANRCGCDLIFMASHGRSNSLSMILGSITLKVVKNSPIAVHISDIGKYPASAKTRAVNIIRDEHRSLSAVLRGMEYLLESARSTSHLPDLTILRAVLSYLNDFSKGFHHPKEEDYLFRKLRGRSSAFDSQMDVLCQQHIEEPKLIDVLDSAVQEAEQGDATGPEAIANAVQALLQHVGKHMGLEEAVLIPAALEFLNEEDWVEIEKAFKENGDPRFGAATDEEFRILFGRIASLFPPPKDISNKSA